MSQSVTTRSPDASRRDAQTPGTPHRNQAAKASLVVVRLGPLLILVALCLVLMIATPNFLTVRNLGNVGVSSSVVAILSLGQLFVIMTAGIDLSVGSLIALTSVCGALWIKHFGESLGSLMIPTMIVTGALVGTISGLLFVKGRLPHAFLPTLAMLMAARGVALLLSGGTPITGLPDSVRYIGSGHIGPIPVAVILVAVVAVLAYIGLNKITWGQWVKAIGGNKEAARRVGVPVDKILISVYAISGATAGIAAIVVSGQTNSAYPTAGINMELFAIAAVIIGGASFMGGRGNILGTLVGALILGVIQNGLNLLNVSSNWQYVALGLVVVVAVELDVLRVHLEGRMRTIRTEESETGKTS